MALSSSDDNATPVIARKNEPIHHLVWKSGVSTAGLSFLASLGELLTETSEAIDDKEDYIDQRRY